MEIRHIQSQCTWISFTSPTELKSSSPLTGLQSKQLETEAEDKFWCEYCHEKLENQQLYNGNINLCSVGENKFKEYPDSVNKKERIRGLPHYHKKCVRKKTVTPPIHFNHLPTRSASFTGFRICKNTCTFWGLWLSQTCLSQKSPTIGSFLFESVLIFKLWNIKSQFYFWLLVFIGTWYEKLCPSFLWITNSYFICGQFSMLNLDIQIKVHSSHKRWKKWIFPLHPFL